MRRATARDAAASDAARDAAASDAAREVTATDVTATDVTAATRTKSADRERSLLEARHDEGVVLPAMPKDCRSGYPRSLEGAGLSAPV